MHKRKTAGLYLASAAIPCCIYLIVLMLLDSVPFGSSSIIICDAATQYIDFASYWKTVLSGENDLFYTFSKALGGDMLNLAAYYLLSPFNLLFLFASLETLPAFYTAVMVLKVSMCGLTFFHASSRFYGCKATHLLFSSCYALMAYNVMYVWNIMWLDGPIVLPLLVLGLWQLMKSGSPLLYILSLAYGLATNFYIGYMLCIFSVIGFLVMIFLMEGSRKEQLGRFGRFCAGSLLGGLTAAAVWLPTFLSISGDRGKTNEFPITLEMYQILSSLPSKFLCGSASLQEVTSGAPQVFCGTAILLFVILFFFSGKNALRQKIAAGCVLFLFLVSFLFVTPDAVWHGFSTVNSMNFRYSFLFSFVLVLIAQYQFSIKETVSFRILVFSAAVLALLFAVSLLRIMPFLHIEGVAASFAVLVITAACLVLHKKGVPYCSVLFCCICILELGINCGLSLNAITDSEWTLDHAEYTRYIRDTREAVDYVKEQDDSFFRMEKTFVRTNNDPAMLQYNGLSHFSSTEPIHTKTFLRKMGFATHYDFWASYTDGVSASVDSLLGVKYLLTQDEVPKTQDYSLLAERNGIRIFQNRFALPLAVLSGQELHSVSTDKADIFLLQNEIWQCMSGDSSPVYLPAEVSMSAKNLDIRTNGDGSYTCTKADPQADAAVRFEIRISHPMPVYFHVPDFDRDTAEIFINGEPSDIYYKDVTWNMECAGSFAEGDSLVIEFRPTGETLNINRPYFYYEDTSALERLAAKLQSQNLQLTQLSSSRFRGSFTADGDQLLMFTIPHSAGWQLEIDGETVPCERVLDCFLAARVTPGAHTFALRYIPQGFVPGAVLSVTTLLAGALWFRLRKRALHK